MIYALVAAANKQKSVVTPAESRGLRKSGCFLISIPHSIFVVHDCTVLSR